MAEWVTVGEAADALRKSERSVRRWIQREQIPVDRTGPVIRVDISGLVSAMPTRGETLPAEVATLQAENDMLRAEVERLTADNARLWEQLDKAQSLAMTLAGQSDRLLEAPGRKRWRWPWQREA